MEFVKEDFLRLKSGYYDIPVLISRPEGEDNPPIIIFCHGFGGNKTEKNRMFFRLASKLNKKGFTTIRFDFSGFGDSPAPSTAFSLSQAVLDLESVFVYLNKNTYGDPSRIGVVAYSLGGLVCAKALGDRLPIKFACMISAVEHFSPPEEDHKSPKRCTDTSFWFRGYEISTDFIEELMSFKGAEAIRNKQIPIKFIHGSADQTVNLTHLVNYFSALSTRDYPPVIIDGADHYYMKDNHQRQLDDAVISFACAMKNIVQ